MKITLDIDKLLKENRISEQEYAHLNYSSISSNAKSLGSGVYELRIDFGPGYRIYYGYERVDFAILLIGGTKKGQQQDIRSARSFWREYKARK